MTLLITLLLAAPPLPQATLEGFRADLARPITIGIASGDREFDAEAIDLLGEREEDAELPRGAVRCWEPEFVAMGSWGRDARERAAREGVGLVVVLDRVKVKKGRVRPLRRVVPGTRAIRELRYTGVLLKADLELHRRGEDGAWDRISAWSDERDSRVEPRSRDLGAVRGDAWTMDPRDELKRLVVSAAWSTAVVASERSVLAPAENLEPWLAGLEPPEEVEFWLRVGEVDRRDSTLDRVTLARLALDRWERIESSRPWTSADHRLLGALRLYCDPKWRQGRDLMREFGSLRVTLEPSASRPELTLSETRKEVLGALDEARGRRVLSVIQRRERVHPRLLVHEELLPDGLLRDAPYPVAVEWHVETFTDDNVRTARRVGRDFLVGAKGAVLVDLVEGEEVVVGEIAARDVDPASIHATLQAALRPRWPGQE